MLSVRLDARTEEALSRTAAAQGLSKSEFLRRLIDERLREESQRVTPWDLGCELFGREGSGSGVLAADRKAILKRKLREKTSHH
jgi:hypothetical protein